MNTVNDSTKPLEVSSANFNAEVLQSAQPVLVAFVAKWSKACQIFESVLDEIASCAEKLKVVWVDADENPDLGLRHDIRGVPTLLYFVAGDVRSKIVGTATKAAILSKFQSVPNANADPRRIPNA